MPVERKQPTTTALKSHVIAQNTRHCSTCSVSQSNVPGASAVASSVGDGDGLSAGGGGGKIEGLGGGGLGRGGGGDGGGGGGGEFGGGGGEFGGGGL